MDDKNMVSAQKMIRAVQTIQQGCAQRGCEDCPMYDDKIRVCILIATRSPQFYRVPDKKE